MTKNTYPIGAPGSPWGAVEKAAWRDTQQIRRSYNEEVLERLKPLEEDFELECYGSLDYAEGLYPVHGLRSRNWHANRPVILISGGVHGYETSGVQGAIRFLAERARDYASEFNFAVAPCISPWGYETINRWNPHTLDPNRSFVSQSSAAEAALVMAWVSSIPGAFAAHFDLHETTDTDNSEFRPALAARDGIVQDNWDIPDGFYLVGDTAVPAEAFQRAIVQSVEQVTHIAPADSSGRIIGAPLAQRGVINYDVGGLGLCAGMTNAPYRTTTEVYPDSPQVDDENCILAQVAAVSGGLDYLVDSLTFRLPDERLKKP
ncbi:MAG: M14 family metallocarboxypeptidase [Congregibacter sp.]